MGTKHGVRGGNGDEFLSSCSSLIKRRFRLQSIAYGTSVFHQLRISQGCLATLTVSPKIAGPLRDLMTYMEAQSIASTTFLINSRSVFQRPSRTTNDCEGWPTKQNQKIHKVFNPNLIFCEVNSNAILLLCNFMQNDVLPHLYFQKQIMFRSSSLFSSIIIFVYHQLVITILFLCL